MDWLADTDAQKTLESPTDGGYLSSDLMPTCYIFSTYYSTFGVTLMKQKQLDKLKEI